MRNLLLFIFLFTATTLCAYAQWKQKTVQRIGPNTRVLSAEVERGEYISTRENENFTAVAVRFSGSLEGAFIKVNNRQIDLSVDEHYERGEQASNLVIVDQPTSDFVFYTGGIYGRVDLIFIHADKLKSTGGANKSLEGATKGCEEPDMVDQSIWRQGLSEPNYNRSFTTTEHMIVHHSATSNELSDYTNVVRNIYLYHTQSNGWSDIGYNYLIAPDGTIFKGRDPADGEQDQVLGAHFCGKNSSTMGICLMGTFSNVPPTEQALAALDGLMAWKADKDALNPFGANPHPLNSSLPVIAGHRDGCNTQCPGDETYRLLPDIRKETVEEIEACYEEEEELVFVLYPNPAEYYFRVELLEGDTHEFTLYNLKGYFWEIYPMGKNGNVLTFSVGTLPSGLYVLHYKSESDLIKRKLVISN